MNEMRGRWIYEEKILRPSVMEIDLDAILHNLQAIQQWVGPSVRLFAVLKSNAYGFGVKEVGLAVDKSTAFGIAVADLSEAVLLRQNGVTKPILVYANHLPSAAPEVVGHNLIPTVDSLEYARAYSAAASEPLKVFVKVDTGRHRNGVMAEEVPDFCRRVLEFGNLKIEGIYAHMDRLSDLEADGDYVQWQFSRFEGALKEIENRRLEIPIRMVASSSEVVQFPRMHLNAVDPGKLIYGVHFPRSGRSRIHLKHAFQSLKTRIILKKKVKPGTPFDGKARFPLREGMQVGIIPLGWGDGLPKYPLNQGEVLVKGKRVRILGSQYVEHARIDLTEVPEAELGDEVVVIGRQGTEEITPEEVADLCGMGASGLTRMVRETVPRVFFRQGRPWRVKTLLGELDL